MNDKTGESKTQEEKTIKRGDIYMANLEPVKGSETGKSRRVLIISNDRGNEKGNTVIGLAISSEGLEKKKNLPHFVEIFPTEQNGQTKDAVIECGQIRVLDKKKRLGNYMGTIEKETMEKVEAAMNTVIALKRCPECDHVLMPNAKRCVNKDCRQIQVQVCFRCTNEIDYRFAYCPFCGNSQGGEN